MQPANGKDLKVVPASAVRKRR